MLCRCILSCYYAIGSLILIFKRKVNKKLNGLGIYPKNFVFDRAKKAGHGACFFNSMVLRKLSISARDC